MLADIAIENLGVIPHAAIELHKGLTVLTGETGAGKTMVVTGLRLLVGGRADASRVRTGAQQAAVEGRFLLDGIDPAIAEAARDIVDAAGGKADENGEYIATRTVSAAGRSKAHLGGRSVPAATLHDFSADLLTIHGQNDQLRLLAPEEQLAAVDRFDPRIAKLLAIYQKAYSTWRKLSKDLAERTKSRRELAQEADRLQFAISEIMAVDPQPGEDVELVALVRRLQDVDELREQASVALGAVDGSAGVLDFDSEVQGASDLVGQAESVLLGSSDVVLRELGERLGVVTSELAEVAGELGSYLSGLPADAAELERLLTRQQELKVLTRKYASDIDGVLVWLRKAEAKLAGIDTSPEALEQLRQEVVDAEAVVNVAGAKLSKARGRAAVRLGEAVTAELQGLAMGKSVFSVELRRVDAGRFGFEEAEFLLAPTGVGVPRPVASSASGGELSRVMLALEVILSAGSRGTTLVFDEVDAGVGGRAAVEIGRRLARLAVHNQVIVVTHLPQVAAYADAHLHVSKDVGDESVSSGVVVLAGGDRVAELSRMLAGLDDTATGRAHAQELLDKAQVEVGEFRADMGV